LKTIERYPVSFCASVAVQYLPNAAQGSATQQAFDKLKCKLSVETSKATSIEAISRIVNKCVAQLGVEEPEGSMSAAPHKTYFHVPAAASAIEPAAGAIQLGGGKGKGGKGGKGKGPGKGTTTVQLGAPPPAKAAPVEPADGERPMPPGMTLCPAGQHCAGFGTLTGCSHWHLAAVIAFLQKKYGNAYISPKARKAIMAAQHAAPAIAPIPPPAPQPPAPPPVPSEAPDKVTQAVGFLAALKKAQQEFSGCAIPASVAPAHGGLASSVSGRIHTPVVCAFALALPAAAAAGAPAELIEAALADAFEMYGEWLP
jgi:hypothetical protein